MATIKGTVRGEDGSGLSGVKVRAHRLDDGAVLSEALSSSAGDALEEFVALRINFKDGAATDISSNSFPLELLGGATVTPSAFPGWGGELNCTTAEGDSPRLTTPASAALEIGGAFCLEFWVTITTFGSSGSMFVRAATPYDPWNASVWAYVSHNGALEVQVRGVVLTTPPLRIVLNERNHLAITTDEAGVIRVFLNGALAAGGNPATDTVVAEPVKAAVWYFGSHPTFSGSAIGGWCTLADIVLTIGDARYDPAGFTPPEQESAPGTPGGGGVGTYELTTGYAGEVYVVGMAPADPARNHSIIRVVPG